MPLISHYTSTNQGNIFSKIQGGLFGFVDKRTKKAVKLGFQPKKAVKWGFRPKKPKFNFIFEKYIPLQYKFPLFSGWEGGSECGWVSE